MTGLVTVPIFPRLSLGFPELERLFLFALGFACAGLERLTLVLPNRCDTRRRQVSPDFRSRFA